MIKKNLIACICLLLIACICLGISYHKPYRLKDCVNKWAFQYDLDPVLVIAIIDVETCHGKWHERNDSYRLHKQRWAIDTVKKYKCDVRDQKIWYSIGWMQVLYLTAIQEGYKGIPEGLHDADTNLKYGCQYLSDKRNVYLNNWHAVSAYNAGRVRFDWRGMYQNQDYVTAVKSEYFRMGGGLK